VFFIAVKRVDLIHFLICQLKVKECNVSTLYASRFKVFYKPLLSPLKRYELVVAGLTKNKQEELAAMK
jgi:hypothetical protein